MNWNPVWLLQCVCDTEFHCLSCIRVKHKLKVECHAIQEGGPCFPCLLVLHLTTEVFSGNSVNLCLHNLLPELASLISKEISIELKNLCAEHVCLFLNLISCLLGFVLIKKKMTTK